MGVITATNLLQFKESQPFFDKLKERLKSFDAAGMIDDGKFYSRVVEVLDELGIGAFKECESFLSIKDGRALLPVNLSVFHAAYKVKGSMHPVVRGINEQRPFVYYTDTEIYKECANKYNCCVGCAKDVDQSTKIVVRTFVNDVDGTCEYTHPTLLKLSSNVRSRCENTEDSPSLFCPDSDEITISDDYLLTSLADDAVVHLQYFGIPINEYGLPMIPKQSILAKAIEWYIYQETFQDFYWDGVPNIGPMLQDARQQYALALAKAQYWVNLPSFQTLINSTRRMRGRNKFWYSPFDKTIMN